MIRGIKKFFGSVLAGLAVIGGFAVVSLYFLACVAFPVLLALYLYRHL
jgi:hypothetical protein